MFCSALRCIVIEFRFSNVYNNKDAASNLPVLIILSLFLEIRQKVGSENMNVWGEKETIIFYDFMSFRINLHCTRRMW